MNRIDFASRISSALRENEVRKPVSSKKYVLHISDDNGNNKDFVIKESSKTVAYTINDVSAILDAAAEVMLDALKNGEKITLHGFGSICLQHVNGGKRKNFETGEMISIPPRYIPKFTSGNELKRCAKMYTQLEDEKRKLEGNTYPIADDGGDF